MAEQRKILAIKDLVVKFRVRSRILTSIRNISFDIYDGETVAIVGESGSGKSVLTKTITNMLESNGYISNGSIVYYPNEAAINDEKSAFKEGIDLINLHRGALTSDSIKGIKKFNKVKIKNLNHQKSLKENLNKIEAKIEKLTISLNNQKEKNNLFSSRRAQLKIDSIEAKIQQEHDLIAFLATSTQESLQKSVNECYEEIANFVPLSLRKKLLYNKSIQIINTSIKEEIKIDEASLLKIIDFLTEVKYKSNFERDLFSVLNKIKDDLEIEQEELDFLFEAWNYQKKSSFFKKREAMQKLKKVRGGTVATIFQDPMTSLNPLLSVGYQICEVLKAHHNMSFAQAKVEAISLMTKVGIAQAEKRFKDIPGKYSGGMRQRIVIAIALACRPKILICDEPTTALDVTVQAQVLQLIKDLKEEYQFTVIFITHDLGVVANIADRVAVVYAGQIIEHGTTEEIFFDPKHPYTWALLSSLPQLGIKGEELFAIEGTPPSLFNEIKGDAFAPRNNFALDIDYKIEPPMFQVSPTHWAKTWLLDPRSPKVEKPKALSNIKKAVEQAKVGE